jgi:ATP-dependent DNA helicase PIF1
VRDLVSVKKMASNPLEGLRDIKLQMALKHVSVSNPSSQVAIMKQLKTDLKDVDAAQKQIAVSYLKKVFPAPSDASVNAALADLYAVCQPQGRASLPRAARVPQGAWNEIVELEMDDDEPVKATSSAAMDISASGPFSKAASSPSAFDTLMQSKGGKRQAVDEIRSPTPAKKPKRVSSTASKYVPPQSSDFVSKNAAPTSFVSSASMGTLQPHATPKSLQAQRAVVGVHNAGNAGAPLAPSPFSSNYAQPAAKKSKSVRLPPNNVTPSQVKVPDFSQYQAVPMGPFTGASKFSTAKSAGVATYAGAGTVGGGAARLASTGSFGGASSSSPASSSGSQPRQLPASFGAKKTGGKISHLVNMPKRFDIPSGGIDRSLSAGQRAIVTKALEGSSFFFTGAAGTGKSRVLMEIKRLLQECYQDEFAHSVAITAPTGIAAIELGGWTIHSFAGIGIGTDDAKTLSDRVRRNPQAADRWRKVSVLIIDEISMVSAELFDKLAYIASAVRGSNKGPFGGIQLILCGDFYQLPPIIKSSGSSAMFQAEPAIYAFQAKNWKTCVQDTYVLDKIFRQSGDLTFVKMLNEIRVGDVSPETHKMLLQRVDPSGGSTRTQSKGFLEPTRLFPILKEVNDFNMKRLESMNTELHEFKAVDWASDESSKSTFASSVRAPAILTLRQGAQVILIRNMKDSGLVNGSRGVVVGFVKDTTVAGFPFVPRVKFGDEDDALTICITPESWTWERNEVKLAERVQIPLILGYALSIHKCQGMTLTSAEISLHNVFTDGQAYVALSRVTSLEGLRITTIFKPNVYRTSPLVTKFYQTLSKVE